MVDFMVHGSQGAQLVEDCPDSIYNHWPSHMISGVMQSFASITLLRVLSRVLEFVLRVYLIREVLSPEILAELIGLDLLLTTSLHITKNCFKLSYQQVQATHKHTIILSSMNLMTLGIGATVLSACAAVGLHWGHRVEMPYIGWAMAMYAGASVLEAAREKYSVGFVIEYQYRKMALIELASYLPKTLMLFVAARLGLFQEYGILVFGAGQLLFYSMCLAISFCYSEYKQLGIQPIGADDAGKRIYLDPKTKQILRELSYISVLKLCLQQFEKIVLVFKNAVAISSIYSLVSNLGSIVVRFLFAPLEEITYNYYARGSAAESKHTLLSLIKAILIFGCICVGYGWRYAQNVLGILYGAKWLNPESVLAFQCFMLLVSVMGLNGTMQAFVMARGDAVKTIPKFKYFTIVSTSIYIVCSVALVEVGLGAAGLFLGNAVGMLTRMGISWHIEISNHITLGEFVRGVRPSRWFLGMLAVCLSLSYYIKGKELGEVVDLAVGVALFAINLLPVLYQYRGQLREFMSSRLGRGGSEIKQKSN